MSAIFAARGDYRQAYLLGIEADELSSKAARDNAGKHIVELTKRYETESKQREIDKLNRSNQQQASELEHRSLEQRWLWTVLVGSIFTLVFSGFFVLRLRRSKEALKKSETLYRSVVTAMSEGMVLLEANGIIISLNPAAEKILGLSTEQVLGRSLEHPPWSTIYEDGAPFPRAQHPAMQTLSTGQPQFNVVMGLCRTKGDFVWISINSQPLFIEGASNPHAVVTTFHDITERKRVEAVLRDSEQRYRLVFENSSVSIWEEDFSAVKMVFDNLKKRGITNIEAYFDRHPETVLQCAELAKVVDVNHAALVLHKASDKKELIDGLVNTFTPESFVTFRQELISLWNGENKMQEDAIVKTLTGETRNVTVHFTVCPGYEASLSKVLVSIIDITERKLAEQALVVREREFRTLAENIPDNIIRYDTQARKIYVNSTVVRQMGIEAHKLIGQTPEETPPEVRTLQIDEFSKNVRRVLETGEPQALEVQVRHAEKGMQVHNVKFVAERDEQGRIVGALAVGRDITELKQAEHDIALMSQALDKVHEAAYLMDESARFLYVNDASCRALGYTRDELLSLSVMDIGPGWTVDMVREVWQRQRESGTVQSFEAFHRRKDGSTFPVEINANQFEYDGKFYGLALVRDITDRKQAEGEIRALNAALEQRVLDRTEALRLQTRYLRALIDTLPMMAWLKDKESRFLVVNQATAIANSYNAEEMVGKTDMDFWPREQAEAYRADDAEVMTTGRRKTVEELLADQHGPIWIETFKAPVLDEDGSVLGTVGIARDISDRKALETARGAALTEAKRLATLRSEFMARMSHELRTPLNGILGYAQLLQGENRDNERQSMMLNVILQSGEYLLDLINDILDFAKIEAGKQELNLSDFPLPRFLRNLASIVTIKAEQKNLDFVCDIAQDVPTGIRADETRLRQVLLNLLSNAVKYSERGKVCLKVTVLKNSLTKVVNVKSNRLRFEIQDTGIGIETAQLKTIFQAFEQAGDKRNRTGGTGLGLPISRELILLMGSDIHVTSRVGEGSCFWFDLDVPVVDIGRDFTDEKLQIMDTKGLVSVCW